WRRRRIGARPRPHRGRRPAVQRRWRGPRGPKRWGPGSLAAVIEELEIEAEIMPLEKGNHFLQRVAVLAGDADHLALDRRLHLFLGILDDPHDLAGFLAGDAALNVDGLAHRAASGALDRAEA